MAQNITIANATYSAVPAIDVPKQGGGTARYVDTAETAFVITVSWDSDEGMWLPDCTFAQVQTAYSAGRQIAIEVDPGEAIEDVQAAGVYDPTFYAYVVTSATYTGDKHTVYLLSNNGVAVDDEWAFYDAPTGNINITQSGVTDVTAYATATVAQGEVYADANSGFYTENGVYKWHFQPRADVEVGDSRGTPGYIPDFYYTSGADHVFDALHSTTVTPSASTQTIGGANTMMAGAVTVAAMPSGSATPPTTISGSQATLTTGTNTITLQKTLSVTPQVSAGYVSAGTAGNVLVNLNANVTTKAATSYHPSSSQQTIASDTYLTGTQTINAVTTTNLIAANIKSGVVVQVGDSSDSDCVTSVTGTYSGGGTLTVATKTATLSAVGKTLSFTGLSGTPKYWFVKTTSQISSSGSTTIYYITDGFWDGTSVKGNSFRVGSTRRIYSWTSGVTQSYSGGTLTITGGSATGSSPGQFYNGTYELTYVY